MLVHLILGIRKRTMPRVASEVHVYGYGTRKSRVRSLDAYGANKFFANQPVARIACSTACWSSYSTYEKMTGIHVSIYNISPRTSHGCFEQRGGRLASYLAVPNFFTYSKKAVTVLYCMRKKFRTAGYKARGR